MGATGMPDGVTRGEVVVGAAARATRRAMAGAPGGLRRAGGFAGRLGLERALTTNLAA